MRPASRSHILPSPRRREPRASVLENPWPGTGHIGRAWFAGGLDALADRLDGGQRSVRALPHLVADDRAELF